MMIATHITTSIRQLLANKGKAALTMLGVIIGIGSVIYMMTMGEVAKQFLLSQITKFGTNVVEIGASGSIGPGGRDDYELSDDDVEQLESSSLLPEITQVADAKIENTSIEYLGDEYNSAVYGVSENFADVNNLNVLYGRFLRDSDARSALRTIVIDENFAEDLFTDASKAVNKKITLDGNSFTIIGVIEALPSFGPVSNGSITYTSLPTLRQFFVAADEQNIIEFIMVEFAPGTNAASFEERIKYELYRIKNIHDVKEGEEPFLVVSRQQFLSIFDSILLGIQLFVSAIAAISLVVGGIGIMNIMLVTVKERTKEIGLRKAVGAKNRSILTQFLIEAIILTTIGGLVGAGGGIGLSALSVVAVNAFFPEWGLNFVFVPSALILACSVSITTGIVFGLYPAWKASRLHPIESLRYE